MEEVICDGEDLRDDFYKMMLPFYDGDDLYELPLSKLQEEMYKVIKAEPYFMVGLLEGLQTVRLNIFTFCDKAIPLLRKFNVSVGLGVEMRLRNVTTLLRAGKTSLGVKKSERGEEIMRAPPPRPPHKDFIIPPLIPIADTPILVVKPLPGFEKILLPFKKHFLAEVEIKRNDGGGVLIINPLTKPVEKKARPSSAEEAGTSNTTRPSKIASTMSEPLGIVGEVASRRLYGFPEKIGRYIEESMECRKLIMNEHERDFDADELAILQPLDFTFDFDGEDIWVRIKMLKHRFKELKKKQFVKKNDDRRSRPMQPPLMSADASAAKGTPADVIRINRVGPEIVNATIRLALRNWIFQIEDVLFNFIIYELYNMLAQDDRAEVIFQNLWGWLTDLRDNNQGNVPITVYKVIYMMENMTVITLENGMVLKLPKLEGNVPIAVLEKLGLEEMVDTIQGIILQLMQNLKIARLSTQGKTMAEGEAAIHEETLEKIEEKMREMEWRIRKAND